MVYILNHWIFINTTGICCKYLKSIICIQNLNFLFFLKAMYFNIDSILNKYGLLSTISALPNLKFSYFKITNEQKENRSKQNH